MHRQPRTNETLAVARIQTCFLRPQGGFFVSNVQPEIMFHELIFVFFMEERSRIPKLPWYVWQCRDPAELRLVTQSRLLQCRGCRSRPRQCSWGPCKHVILHESRQECQVSYESSGGRGHACVWSPVSRLGPTFQSACESRISQQTDAERERRTRSNNRADHGLVHTLHDGRGERTCHHATKQKSEDQSRRPTFAMDCCKKMN